MKVVSTLLVAAAVSGALLSCSKKDDAAPSKTSLLTSNTWKLTAVTVSPGIPQGGTTITDYYAQLPACQKDNIYRYATPNVYTDDEGPSKCNSTDPQTNTGTWVFNTDQTVLTISEGGTTQSVNLTALDANMMVQSFGTTLNNVTYTFTATYKH